MKYEEPSGQTVREILNHYSSASRVHKGEWLVKATDEAESAINAHIVSVLEELKDDIDTVQPESDYYAEAIAAVIAKYKKGGNHEGPRSTRPM